MSNLSIRYPCGNFKEIVNIQVKFWGKVRAESRDLGIISTQMVCKAMGLDRITKESIQ